MKTKEFSIGILLLCCILYLLLFYTLPMIGYFSAEKGLTVRNFYISRLFIWFVFLPLFLYCKFIENEKMVLQPEKNYPLAKMIGMIALVYITSVFCAGILNFIIKIGFHEASSAKMHQMNLLFKGNYFLIFFVSATAAVTEEYFFRGYIQTRLQKIYQNPTLSIGITSLLFGMLHFSYGTIANIAIPIVIGIIFGIFYQKYSNLKVLIIVHFLVDFLSLLAMNFMQK